MDFYSNQSPSLVLNMMEKVLADIRSIKGIQTSFLISNDGDIIGGEINLNGFNTKNYAVMICMLMRSAAHTSKELEYGDLEYFLLNGTDGGIILVKTVSSIILAIFTETNVNIDLILFEIKNTCEGNRINYLF